LPEGIDLFVVREARAGSPAHREVLEAAWPEVLPQLVNMLLELAGPNSYLHGDEQVPLPDPTLSVSLSELSLLVTTVACGAGHMHRAVARKLAPIVYTAVRRILLSARSSMMRNIDDDTMKALAVALRRLLSRAFPPRAVTRALEALSMDLSSRLLEADQFTVRLYAVKAF
jgi:hypothetical protein